MGPGWWQASDGRFYPPEAAPGSALPPPPQAHFSYAPGGYQAPYPPMGPIGRPENVALQFLLAVVTFGLYGIYWAYKCHEEVKVHTGEGIGGPLGALIYVVAGVVTLFLLPIEIQRMYERSGWKSPVSAMTAFWILLFGIPWYVKCQQALNQYWIAKGAPPP
jgi:hypothetical protein